MNSEIVHHPGGTTFAGPDAVNVVRAAHLVSALKLYAKTGMRMTRHASPSVLLALAKEFTGKDYKGRNKYEDAADDVKVWLDTMRAALPTTVIHRDGTKEQR